MEVKKRRSRSEVQRQRKGRSLTEESIRKKTEYANT